MKTLKLLLLGDSGVGKSSLLLRFVEDTFTDEHQATIGVDYKFKPILDNTVKLMVWDTAGQERFRTLTSSYYRGAHGVILVYDVGSLDSFNDIEAVWLKELDRNLFDIEKKEVCILLIGNKIDTERQVSREEGRQLARKLNCLFMECSAKTRDGVEEAFQLLIEKVVQSGVLELDDDADKKGRAKLIDGDRKNETKCAC